MSHLHAPAWTYRHDLEIYRNDYISAFERVLDSGMLLFGEELKSLEKEFSSYIGVAHSVGCDNATNAIFLALKALDIGPGDEILTVPTTAIPTISAIVHAGAKPVLVDVNTHGQINPELIEAAITTATKAIIPVHLYGYPSDMRAICDIAKKYKLNIIEDCSQAHGASIDNVKIGSYGDLSCFSFYPTKPLGAFGDAGMICSNSESLASVLRKLRFYGISANYVADVDGYNSRMDEMQAAFIREKLKRLDCMREHRMKIAATYQSMAGGLIEPLFPPRYATTISGYLVPFLFMGDRDGFVEKCLHVGIGLNVSYRTPIHLMPAYEGLGYSKGDFPIAEFICKHIFSPPIADSYPLEAAAESGSALAKVAQLCEGDEHVSSEYSRLFS